MKPEKPLGTLLLSYKHISCWSAIPGSCLAALLSGIQDSHHDSIMQRRLVMMQGAHMRAKTAAQLGSHSSAGAMSAQNSEDKAYAEMFRRRVMSLRHQGRYEECLRANEEVLDQFPTSVTALCLKSEVLLRTRKTEDALQAAHQAAESGEILQNAVTRAQQLKTCSRHEVAGDLFSTRSGIPVVAFRC